MARNSGWRIFLGLTAAGLLSACVETVGSDGGASPGLAPGGGTARAGAEVEAPDVFQANESALWDGRPSLGGIWVASPDAKDPERVVMFNPATGKSVKGALFRRERDNPGPRLQLSSDAAEALGVLAGAPTEIEVTALRKQEVEEAAVVPEAAAATAEAAAQPAEAAKPAGEDEDATAVAAAALDAVDSGATGAADPGAVAGEEPAKPMTAKERRAAAKAEREAKKAAEAAAKAAAEGAPATEGEAPVTPGAVTGGAIEAAPLDAGASDTSKDKGVKAKPAAEAAAVEPAPAASGGAGRTIQIGSFSKEDNAKRAVEALSKIDIAAEVKKVEKDGKIFWGVVAKGDAALLQKIKDAGFADAYFLK